MNLKAVLSFSFHYCVSRFRILQFLLSGESSSNRKRIQSLKNKYSGKRCFIICNGPSLQIADLDRIHEHGDISIGINMVNRVEKQTQWRPTCLNATDDCVFLSKNRDIVANADCETKIYSQEDYHRTRRDKGYKCWLYLKRSRKYLDKPRFSTDLDRCTYSIGTSAYEAIELAVYLGCRELYIIGCDMSYQVNISRDGKITHNNLGKNHFYTAEKDAMKIVEPYPIWEMQTAFEAARSFADKIGIKIYNATRGGHLEAFERVDFDSLF